jgi:hypothetical protein
MASTRKFSAVILIPSSVNVSKEEEPDGEGMFHFGQKMDKFAVEPLAGRLGSRVLTKLTGVHLEIFSMTIEWTTHS